MKKSWGQAAGQLHSSAPARPELLARLGFCSIGWGLQGCSFLFCGVVDLFCFDPAGSQSIGSLRRRNRTWTPSWGFSRFAKIWRAFRQTPVSCVPVLLLVGRLA